MQSDKTIQFWDEYHHENDSEEWISKPGEELLAMIFDQIHDGRAGIEEENKLQRKKRCVSILEIGCGTSTFVRDMKRHIEERHPMIKVIACGTDVSAVCINVNNKRDCHYVCHGSSTNDDLYRTVDNNAIEMGKNTDGTLWYEVLNLLDGEPSRQNWDLIIDKGCLDTFLFRSRQRGARKKLYPESLRTILDNLHGWLATTATTRSTAAGCGNEKIEQEKEEQRVKQELQPLVGRGGVYVCVTPRAKVKAMRDYAGFSSVKRYPLPKTYRSKLEGKKNDGRCSNSCGNDYRDSPGYLFVCTKKDEYNPGISLAFPADGSGNNNSTLQSEEDECPRCMMTFREFRKDEGIKFRGLMYWTRKWKAHHIHCKGGSVSANQKSKDEDPSAI